MCNKEGGFTEDDFVVEFLGEVMLHSDTSSFLLAAVASCNVLYLSILLILLFFLNGFGSSL